MQWRGATGSASGAAVIVSWVPHTMHSKRTSTGWISAGSLSSGALPKPRVTEAAMK